MHNLMVESMGNRIIMAAHQQNFDKIKMIRLHGRSPRYLPLAMEEHLAVIAAMKSRDPERAAAALAAPSAERGASRAGAVTDDNRIGVPMETAPAKIGIGDLTLDYVNPETGVRHRAVEHLDLDVRRNEFLCVVGPSGCGKSTLLSAIAGFLRPTAGTLPMDGRAITGPGAERGVVFQEYALLPWMNVLDNAALGPQAARHAARRALRDGAALSSRSPTCTASSTSIRTSCRAA